MSLGGCALSLCDPMIMRPSQTPAGPHPTSQRPSVSASIMWWPLGSWVVELATSLKLNVLAPFLCTVGNVVTETDQQIQKTIDAGMLKVLGQLPKHQSSEGGCLGRE